MTASSSLSIPANSMNALSPVFEESNFKVNNQHHERKDAKKKKKPKKPKQSFSSNENEAAGARPPTGGRPGASSAQRGNVARSTAPNVNHAPAGRAVNKSTKNTKKQQLSRSIAAKPQKPSPLQGGAADVQYHQAAVRSVYPQPANNAGPAASTYPNKQQYHHAAPPMVKSSQRHARDVESVKSGSHSQQSSSHGSYPTDLHRMELGNPLNQTNSRSIPPTQSRGPQPSYGDRADPYKPPKQHATLPMGDVSLSMKSEDDRYQNINDDVYNMFFLSRIGGPAFFYAAYVFILKMTLYSVLIVDVIGPLRGTRDRPTSIVLTVQFLILPVAVAMQEDLIATFHVIANVKYCPSVKERNPDASPVKFHVANFCRGIDGAFSLAINYIVLIGSQDVLSMFLNFAALQFLQLIDNVALHLAADGHISNRLEAVAKNVTEAKLLKQDHPRLTMLDTVLFCVTLLALMMFWFVFHFVSTE